MSVSTNIMKRVLIQALSKYNKRYNVTLLKNYSKIRAKYIFWRGNFLGNVKRNLKLIYIGLTMSTHICYNSYGLLKRLEIWKIKDLLGHQDIHLYFLR